MTESTGDGERDGASTPDSVLPPVFRPLSFIGVAMELPSQYPIVTLQEFDAPHRVLRIPVGVVEGNAIAYAAKRLPTPRPLTHELMTSVLVAFGLGIETLRIVGVEQGIFLGELVVSGPDGQRTLPCRVSDGVTLCLRQRPIVPITVARDVIDNLGIPA